MRALLDNEFLYFINLFDPIMKSRLLFLGPPGAGKGTQAEITCKTNGLTHLSTGELLRAEVAAKTPLGNEASAVMATGELVSDELVLAIVEGHLKKSLDGWLLDGFPRTVPQAEALEEILQAMNQQIELVLVLQLNDELLIERLLARGRDDDNEAVIANRLDVYRQKTEPLIDYYDKKGLITRVEAKGDIQEIQSQIELILNQAV